MKEYKRAAIFYYYQGWKEKNHTLKLNILRDPVYVSGKQVASDNWLHCSIYRSQIKY